MHSKETLYLALYISGEDVCVYSATRRNFQLIFRAEHCLYIMYPLYPSFSRHPLHTTRAYAHTGVTFQFFACFTEFFMPKQI